MAWYDGTCELIVDSNAHENEFASRIEERGLTVTRAALKTGDVAIVYHGKTILAERKSVADLAAGIAPPHRFIDGQRARLVGEAADNPNTISLVLLHGTRPACDPKTRLGFGHGISGETFHSIVQQSMLPPYNLPILHSISLDGLAEQVVLLRRNLIDGKFDREGLIDSDAKPPSLSRKRRIDTPTDMLIRMLVAIPGFSEKKANAVVERYPSLSSLLSASVSELASVKVGERQLGPMLAKRLRSVF